VEQHYKGYIKGLVADLEQTDGAIYFFEQAGIMRLIFKSPYTIPDHGVGIPVKEIISVNEDYILLQLANKRMAIPLQALVVELWA